MEQNTEEDLTDVVEGAFDVSVTSSESALALNSLDAVDIGKLDFM